MSRAMGPLLSLRVLAVALVLTAPAFADEGPSRFTDRTNLWERLATLSSGFTNMYQFEILHEPDDLFYPYKAWFFGWMREDGNPGYPGCDAICAARSAELIRGWEVYSGPGRWTSAFDPAEWVPVVTAEDDPWDEWHNGDPTVARVGGRYFLAYSSTGNNSDRILFGMPGDTDGSLQVIMGATSGDGIHWRKSPRPLLMYEPEVGQPRSEDDVYPMGAYARPALLWDEGRWKLWFDYWAAERGGVSMAYAECRGDFLDPEAWYLVRGNENPCLPDWPNPDVVKIEDLYFSYSDPSGYEGHPWRGRKIAEAVSLDGIHWIVLGYVEPEPGVPATHVPQALVQEEGGRRWIYLTYANQRGGEPYDYRYNAIRIMRREVTSAELASLRSVLRAAA